MTGSFLFWKEDESMSFLIGILIGYLLWKETHKE